MAFFRVISVAFKRTQWKFYYVSAKSINGNYLVKALGPCSSMLGEFQSEWNRNVYIDVIEHDWSLRSLQQIAIETFVSDTDSENDDCHYEMEFLHFQPNTKSQLEFSCTSIYKRVV